VKKRTYRRKPVNDFELSRLQPETFGSRVVFAVDIAKVDMVAAIADGHGQVCDTVDWKAPSQNATVIDLLRRLRDRGFTVEAVMEASGTYGDVLRQMLEDSEFPVFRVNGKKTYDARELYDGVPSMHDAKAAAILARLHVEGLSAQIQAEPEDKRSLRAAIAIADLHQRRYLELVHKLESWLARYWPELPELLALTSASLMALLARIGGPADVAAAPDEARRLLNGISHRLLEDETVDAVVASAATSLGVRPLPLEREALMAIAAEAHRSLRAFKEAKLTVERLSADTPAKALAPVVGSTTAAVIFTEVGDPKAFRSVAGFIKAMGLNLREKSSGKTKGQLKLTKRGPARVRHYLWLAVHRWVQRDPIARAWYQSKKARDGGRASRAVVAMMRKLAKALFHLGRGAEFDSTKLFDIKRLGLA
jgi:transposase